VKPPADKAKFGHDGASLVIGNACWPADRRLEFASMWARGASLALLEKRFGPHGYTASDIKALAGLLASSPYLLTPIERALFVLGGLGRRDTSAPGGFTLHNAPARAADVVAAANRVLAALALPQISYPSAGRG
jgi:hypothetical protein